MKLVTGLALSVFLTLPCEAATIQSLVSGVNAVGHGPFRLILREVPFAPDTTQDFSFTSSEMKLDFTVQQDGDPDTVSITGIIDDQLWGVGIVEPFSILLAPNTPSVFVYGPRLEVPKPIRPQVRHWVQWSFSISRTWRPAPDEIAGWTAYIRRQQYTSVPEPGSWLLGASGLLAGAVLTLTRRLRQK